MLGGEYKWITRRWLVRYQHNTGYSQFEQSCESNLQDYRTFDKKIGLRRKPCQDVRRLYRQQIAHYIRDTSWRLLNNLMTNAPCAPCHFADKENMARLASWQTPQGG